MNAERAKNNDQKRQYWIQTQINFSDKNPTYSQFLLPLDASFADFIRAFDLHKRLIKHDFRQTPLKVTVINVLRIHELNPLPEPENERLPRSAHVEAVLKARHRPTGLLGLIRRFVLPELNPEKY